MHLSDAQIRKAELSDAEAVASLAAALFPLGCPAETRAEDLAEHIGRELTPERFRELLGDPGVVVHLASVSGKLAGFAMVAWGGAAPEAVADVRCELRKLYVDPAFHGQGLAGRLVDAVFQTAERLGHRSLWLSVHSGNERAIGFYSKCGFRVVGSQEFLVGSDAQKDYVMRCDREGGPGAAD